MKRSRKLVVVIVAISAITFGVSCKAATTRSQSGAVATNAPTDQQIVDQLVSVVQQRTNVRPTMASVYHTTRSEAGAVVDAQIFGYDPAAPVTVVVFSGNFTDNSASVPAGRPQPTGTIITFVVDPTTGGSTDYGIVPSMSNAQQLGQAEQVPVRVHR